VRCEQQQDRRRHPDRVEQEILDACPQPRLVCLYSGIDLPLLDEDYDEEDGDTYP
jgi:hypothetical protein